MWWGILFQNAQVASIVCCSFLNKDDCSNIRNVSRTVKPLGSTLMQVLQFDADIPFFHFDKKGYACPFQLQFLQSYADIPSFTASETTARLCSLCSNHFVVHLLISNANIVNWWKHPLDFLSWTLMPCTKFQIYHTVGELCASPWLVCYSHTSWQMPSCGAGLAPC